MIGFAPAVTTAVPTAAETAGRRIIVRYVVNAPTTRSSAKIAKCVWNVQGITRSIASAVVSVVWIPICVRSAASVMTPAAVCAQKALTISGMTAILKKTLI